MLNLIARVSVRLGLAALFLFLFIALSTVVLILTPYRLLVWATAKCSRPDLVGFVTGPTNVLFSWWNKGTRSSNVCCFFIIEGQMSVEEMQEVVKSRLLSLKAKDGSGLYDKLKQTFVNFMGYSFLQWDHNFDIANHIRAYSDEGGLPAQERYDENSLRHIMEVVPGNPWKRGQSPWEGLIINNYFLSDSSKPHNVFILRISHAIADGYSLKRAFLIATQTQIPEFDFSRFEPSLWKKILGVIVFPIRMFYDLADQQFENASHGGNEWRIESKDADYNFNFAVTNAFPVEIIKAIKNKYKVSYNAILFAAVGAGMRRLMEEAGQNAPSSMACILPVPKPRHPGGLTNHVFAGRMPLRLVSAENPKESLTIVHQDLVKAVKAVANPALEICLGLNSLLPMCLAQFLYKMDNANVVMGNFPVITTPIHLNGKRVIGLIPTIVTMNPSTPFGATVSMGGVNGLQIITVNMEESVFPDKAQFRKLSGYIEQAIVEMSNSIESVHSKPIESDELRRRRHIFA